MTSRAEHAAAFASGILCANSLPHLATGATGHQHLTPLAGRTSSRWINTLWGGLNLAGGLALIVRTGRGGPRWDSRLVAFDVGVAVFAVWMATSEQIMKLNWSRDP